MRALLYVFVMPFCFMIIEGVFLGEEWEGHLSKDANKLFMLLKL